MVYQVTSGPRCQSGLRAPPARGLYDDTVHNQGRWARWVPAALLTVCTVVALVLQFLPVVAIGAQWAGNHDVASGGCGWDGTCSDVGVVDATMWCALVLVVAELAVGGLLGTAKRFAITIMVGCSVSWVVMFQDAFVMSQAAAHDPDDQGQARLFLTWGTRALMVDAAIALACCLAWFFVTRRRRPRTPRSPAPVGWRERKTPGRLE